MYLVRVTGNFRICEALLLKISNCEFQLMVKSTDFLILLSSAVAILKNQQHKSTYSIFLEISGGDADYF